MAIHNFDYTYNYVGIKTMPMSIDDSTQIVREICVEVTAVDQADSSQTLSENLYAPLQGIFSIRDNGLPDNFITVDNLTESNIINWYKNSTTTEDLDGYFTWKIYGPDEASETTPE
jgi:hypothetical protein